MKKKLLSTLCLSVLFLTGCDNFMQGFNNGIESGLENKSEENDVEEIEEVEDNDN